MKYIIILSLFIFMLAACDEGASTPAPEPKPQAPEPICPDECVTSYAGIALIKQFEGFSPCVYDDAAGKPTVGYGHLIKPNEDYTCISLDYAESLLKKDIQDAEKAVRHYVNIIITQEQFDALVSFTFNLGSGNLSESTLLAKLNDGNKKGAKEEFKRWVYASNKKMLGLMRRREAESILFGGNNA